jgi:uncharacterized protein (TIGR02145 family)
MKGLLFSFPLFILLMLSSSTFSQESDFLMDERDGNIYLILNFNEQWWMCHNLKFDIGDGSSCYEDDENNCMLKGRWYTFEAAKAACPQGYRLPSDEDWKGLELFLGMDEKDLDQRYNRNSGTIGKFLKTGGGLGFDADFAGLVNPNGNDSYIETKAYFWSSTTVNESSSWSRVIEETKDGIDRQIITNSYGLSVRCVKDAIAEE